MYTIRHAYIISLFLGSCDDGKEVSPITGSGGTPFNPAFPIRIDSIYPKAGSAGQRVLIYGENFGNNLPNWKFILVVRKARL